MSLLQSEDIKKLFFIIFFVLIGTFLELLGVGLIIPLIALMGESNIVQTYPEFLPIHSFLGNPTQKTLVMYSIVLLVFIYIFKTSFLTFLAWKQTSFAFDLQEKMSKRLFSLYLKQPYIFHIQSNSSKLTNNVVNEIGVYVKNIVLPLLLLFVELMVIIAISIMMAIIEPIGTVILVAILGTMLFLVNFLTKKKITQWGRIRQHHQKNILREVGQGFGSVTELILGGKVDEFVSRFNSHNAGAMRVGKFQSVILQLPRLWFELFAVIGLLILAASITLQSKDTDSLLPIIAGFAVALFRMLPSANRITSAVGTLRYGLPVLEFLQKEFDFLENNQIQGARKVDAVDVKHEFSNIIALRNVSYKYPTSNENSINNLSMDLDFGKTIGIIGASGSGKSTLIRIILGLIEPQKGKVLVDGSPIVNNIQGWYRGIGYVPQNIYITDDSFISNIAFGIKESDIDKNRVLDVIKKSELDSLVRELSDGLETMMGERGARISGGQLQRIGLARALYHDPSVLILDEATSSLDTDTENKIMETVGLMQSEKTIIIVAHRYSTLKKCDCIT